MFTVVTGASSCQVTNDGMCVTDGSGSYSNNERCTIVANVDMSLNVQEFNTESCCDRLTVGGTQYKGSGTQYGPVDQIMAAGEMMTWYTDGSVVAGGFTICGLASAFTGDDSTYYNYGGSASAPPPAPHSAPSSLMDAQLLGSANIGRLEVLHNGEWGTACRFGFTDDDADVACMLHGLEPLISRLRHS